MPIADRRLDDRHGGHRRRIGAQDARPERNGRYEIQPAQQRALLLRKPALRSDEQRQLALGDRLERRQRVLAAMAFVAEEDAALATFLADGPSELELARARTRLVAETVFARDNQSSLARIFGSALAVGETVEDVLAWPQRIEAVGRDAVIEAARRYLKPDRSVTGLLLPA